MDQSLTDTLKQILGSRAVVVLTQIAVGLGLLYAIDKFFKLVEEKLSDDTKLEIAVWLLGVKIEQKAEPWPETFARVFDRVFGTKHLSWKCFWRSCLASYSLFFVGLFRVLLPVVFMSHFRLHEVFGGDGMWNTVVIASVGNVDRKSVV